MKRKFSKNFFIIIIACILIIAVVFALMAGRKLNQMLASPYSVKGVDVSHYQGNIDWIVLSEQNIDFAYIKATEGTTHIDEFFEKNRAKAMESGVLTGAYHFFSFTSSGESQAENYINTVGSLLGMLPPAVDVEYYKGVEPDKESVVRELGNFLDKLEEHYGVRPIIYTTYSAYYNLLSESFEEYPLWIRNVYFKPGAFFAGKWIIWQYSDVAVLDGYEGEEKYIDLNVFNGSLDELRGLLVE